MVKDMRTVEEIENFLDLKNNTGVESYVFEDDDSWKLFGDDGNFQIVLGNGFRICFSIGQYIPRSEFERDLRSVIDFLGIEVTRREFSDVVACR